MRLKHLWSLKPWIILAAFLAVWFVVPTVVKSFTHANFFQFQAPIWNLEAKAYNLGDFWALKNHSKQSLLEAGRDLARLNASYELRLQENDKLREEIDRLETLLKLPKIDGHEYVWARIIKRDTESWWHNAIIQKGKKDGVFEGAAVIYGQGVVGRVKKVYKNYSQIELVSSPTFRIASRFSGDQRPITYKGAPNLPFRDPTGAISNVPTDSRIRGQAPLKLVTSHLGGVFPDGLTIGYVSELQPGSDGLFKRANVLLDNRLHNVEEVAVLIPLTRHFTDEE